jgi:hypothetical protein
MTVNVDGGCRTPSPEPQALLILLEEETSKQDSGHMTTLPETQKLSDKPPAPPIFFRYVVMHVQFIREYLCRTSSYSPPIFLVYSHGLKD